MGYYNILLGLVENDGMPKIVLLKQEDCQIIILLKLKQKYWDGRKEKH